MSDAEHLDDIPLTTRAFAVALGHILQDNEGIVVKLDNNARVLVVHRADGRLRLTDYSDDPEMCEYSNGQMLWLHDH